MCFCSPNPGRGIASALEVFGSPAEGTGSFCSSGSSSGASWQVTFLPGCRTCGWDLELIAGRSLKETPCRGKIKKLGCQDKWVRPTEYKSLEAGDEIIPYPAGSHLENCASFIGGGDTIALRNTTKEQL